MNLLLRRLQLPPNYNVTLQLWDIGGQSIGSQMISNYISGAKLSSKTIKANKYKLQDEDGEPIALPDPNKIYMKSSSTGTYKALDLYDFDKFMQELKISRGIQSAKHNKAMNLINTTGPMASNNDETKGEVEITDEVVNEFA